MRLVHTGLSADAAGRVIDMRGQRAKRGPPDVSIHEYFIEQGKK